MTVQEIGTRMKKFLVKQGGPAFSNDKCMNWLDEHDPETKCCIMGCCVPIEYRNMIQDTATATHTLNTLREAGYEEFNYISPRFFVQAQELHDSWARENCDSDGNIDPDAMKHCTPWDTYITEGVDDLIAIHSV